MVGSGWTSELVPCIWKNQGLCVWSSGGLTSERGINIRKYSRASTKANFGPSGTVAKPNNENIVIFRNLLTRVAEGAHYVPDSCFDMNSPE